MIELRGVKFAGPILERRNAEIERLRAALKECSDDLAAYIEHHYARTLDYPSQRARYDADMTIVLEARKLLAGEGTDR